MTLEETSPWIDEQARLMFVRGTGQALEEMGDMARQIEEMHLEFYETDINDTTHKQHNIFVQKDIKREIKRSRDSPNLTDASMRPQALYNRGETLKAAPTSPSWGVPWQRDTIGQLTDEFKKETNTRDDQDRTSEGEQKHLRHTDGQGHTSPS